MGAICLQGPHHVAWTAFVSALWYMRGFSSIQSATTILEEAISELNCAVDSMCTVFDILAKGSIVVCGWQAESLYVVGLR